MAPRTKSTKAVESTSAKEVKATEVTEEKSEAKAAEVKTTAKKTAEKKTTEKKTAAGKTSEKKKAEPKKAEPKPAPKAIETKKDTTKAIETKAGVLVEEKPAKTEKKPAAKKTTEKKPAAKKTSAKSEVKTEMFLQFDGKEFTEKEIFQKVKEVWTKVLKNKVGDMKDVKIYLKPEESAAYYVVNDDTSGKIEL